MFEFSIIVPLISVVLVAGADEPTGHHPAPPKDRLENAPSVVMEYKMFVEGGREDCYYQYVHHDAKLFVFVQVVMGNNIGITIRNPEMEQVYPYMVTASAEYEEDSARAGYYSVCLDNQSKFSTKLVNIYLSTFRYDRYVNMNQEKEELDVAVQNVTSTFKSVEEGVQIMQLYQSISKERKSRDLSLIRGNFHYINNWSVFQCTIVILCTTVQVYFVKNMFKDPRDNNGIKARA